MKKILIVSFLLSIPLSFSLSAFGESNFKVHFKSFANFTGAGILEQRAESREQRAESRPFNLFRRAK